MIQIKQKENAYFLKKRVDLNPVNSIDLRTNQASLKINLGSIFTLDTLDN